MPYFIAFLLFTFTITPNSTYSVTNRPDEVSYYVLAHMNEGADVLLADERLAGSAFAQLGIGDLIQVGYPDGLRLFKVTSVDTYQATMPFSVESGFINADGDVFSSEGLVKLIYGAKHGLVLQTCKDNAQARLFIIAEPVTLEDLLRR
jgi:hypothetical protein